MPGLLRGVARTAMIAGTATAVSNRVSRRQANRWAAQEAPPQQATYAAQPEPQYYEPPPPAPAAPAAPAAPDYAAELEKLAQLKAQGVISEEEFEAKKKQVLGL